MGYPHCAIPQRNLGVCNAQYSLTPPQNRPVIHKIVILRKFLSHGSDMRHQAAAPTSSLPSLMMPCPVCAGRMVFDGRRPISAEVEDTIYACRRCGAELIRTSVRKTASSDKASEAA
jgi:hypothetical protein